MSDVKVSENDTISSTDGSGANPVIKELNEKNIALAPKPATGRKISEWEAIQIAAAGDNDTIDREIAVVEADLQAMNIRSTWFKPQLRLKDPRHFTWLLVGMYCTFSDQRIYPDYFIGFASMGGLLSGVDQSLISGANLYMPSCEFCSITMHANSLLQS
jgi:hypothetical protein